MLVLLAERADTRNYTGDRLQTLASAGNIYHGGVVL